MDSTFYGSSPGQALPETPSWRIPMIFDYSLAALVTAGLMIYLTYALLKPERF